MMFFTVPLLRFVGTPKKKIFEQTGLNQDETRTKPQGRDQGIVLVVATVLVFAFEMINILMELVQISDQRSRGQKNQTRTTSSQMSLTLCRCFHTKHLQKHLEWIHTREFVQQLQEFFRARWLRHRQKRSSY